VSSHKVPYRVGINFVDISRAEGTGLNVPNDIGVTLGAQGFRQLVGNDVTWLERSRGAFNDCASYDWSDTLLLNDLGIYSIPDAVSIRQEQCREPWSSNGRSVRTRPRVSH